MSHTIEDATVERFHYDSHESSPLAISADG